MSRDHHRKAWWHGNLTPVRHDAVDVSCLKPGGLKTWKLLKEMFWLRCKSKNWKWSWNLRGIMNCRRLGTLTLNNNYLAKHAVVDIFVYAVWNPHCSVWIMNQARNMSFFETKQIRSSINCPEVIGIILDIILAMWQLYVSLKYSTCFCQTVASSGQPCLNWRLCQNTKSPLYLGKPDMSIFFWLFLFFGDLESSCLNAAQAHSQIRNHQPWNA